MKINVFELERLSAAERTRLLRRTEEDITALFPTVQPILREVEQHGDEALRRFNTQFGGGTRPDGRIGVPTAELEQAAKRLDPQVKAAIDAAARNIRLFHTRQITTELWMTEIAPGIIAGERTTPITSVGLYVPRGKGAFPSVMLMLAIPAAIAQVPRVIVCTPPAPDGSIDDASLYAASVCGIREIYAVGGAQAVAAMAYGTESVPKVDKILGPGNKYVSAAKRLVYGRIDVGIPAGPSESIILCDQNADPRLAAHDLLIEAEHGPDSAALLVTHSRSLAEAVQQRLPNLVAALPEPRRQFVEAVLGGNGGLVLTRSLEESIAFVNDYAPEHLEVLVDNPLETLPRLQNAGEILLGPYSPISLGNYTLGVNAILPTGGFARTFSCTTIHDFLKRSSFAYVSREGFQQLAGPTKTLAEFEGFPAHYRAVAARDETD